MATEAEEAAFKQWLESELRSTLKIDDAVMFEYLVGIIALESSDDERREAVESFISELTDVPVDAFLDQVVSRWRAIVISQQAAEKDRQALERKKAQEKVDAISREQTAAIAAEMAASRKEISPEERKRRDAILEQYAYDHGSDEEDYVPEDGETDDIPGIAANNNQAMVADYHLQQRMQAKAEHEQKVARDKAQQDREKAEREKVKQRTQKQERRRM
ncbi:hypothetical protein CAOG_03198 [Capsaspora owczarzaki ATCC 30864]|uniref:CCDC43 PWI-like domain-containing protein n=1 Tax=Capsaspora owczarzaki (strain ATCC 30864) TaxID=595528 RepID=A0A0D2X298_CAPO3|nr:hypothetical protein CAOG_03198 [Capsaspora owczarzaki ATCC 30864]KJE92184.1 hypothetical protein CAOG_003198 [Capsaspora owczarzaki ATCC 30864]|eukprot:XP_004364037.1 hypothetical protein CAOG_03198 [Capsaspora owczarzaki ATCC 30864]